MSTDASQDIKDMLVSDGVGTAAASSGWAIWVSSMPNTPDTSIACYLNGGGSPDPKWAFDEPRVQVIVRGARGGYAAAYNKAQEVKDKLLGRGVTTVNGVKYVGIWMTSDIIELGRDDNDRPQFSLTFRINREPPVSGTNRSSLS